MLRHFLVLLATSYVQGETLPDADTRIVGGNSASDGDIPYQVSLRIVETDQHFCGGSIIGKKWILTAAHCMIVDPAQISVVAGTNKLSSGGTRYTVDKIINHMDYNAKKYKLYDDISLIKLKEEIEYTDKIQPIEIGETYINAGEKCLVSGWGYIDAYRKRTDNLQMLEVQVISVSECNNRLGRSGPETERELCTLNKRGEGICQGDSGGPLVCNKKLSAIVSKNVPCARGYPDVFTRVSSHIEWIKKILNEEK